MCRLGSIVIKYVISTSFLTQTLVECLPHVRRCLVFQCIYPKANNTNRGSHWANASQGRQARNRKLKPSRCVRPPQNKQRVLWKCAGACDLGLSSQGRLPGGDFMSREQESLARMRGKERASTQRAIKASFLWLDQSPSNRGKDGGNAKR